eukprot:11494048-Heterocapsa_arctica.AAC.1
MTWTTPKRTPSSGPSCTHHVPGTITSMPSCPCRPPISSWKASTTAPRRSHVTAYDMRQLGCLSARLGHHMPHIEA